MVINALVHVRHCYTFEDGQVIAALIAACLRDGEDVVLSFDGVDDVPSSFVNGAFVTLLTEFSADMVRRHVSIIDSTRQINSLIKMRVASGATVIREVELA